MLSWMAEIVKAHLSFLIHPNCGEVHFRRSHPLCQTQFSFFFTVGTEGDPHTCEGHKRGLPENTFHIMAQKEGDLNSSHAGYLFKFSAFS